MRMRLVSFLSAVLAVLALSACVEAATQDPVVVVFYSEGCEDCLRMEPLLKELEASHPALGFRYIERADADAELMWPLAVKFGVMPSQFPVIFVGKTAIVGASLANEVLLRSAVEACAASGCPSPLASLHRMLVPWTTILIAGLVALVVAILLLA